MNNQAQTLVFQSSFFYKVSFDMNSKKHLNFRNIKMGGCGWDQYMLLQSG